MSSFIDYTSRAAHDPPRLTAYVLRFVRYALGHGLDRFGLLVIIMTYVTLSLYQLQLPGLHYDEAFEAVPALQILRGQPVVAFRNGGLLLGRQLYPLMTQDYIGAINTYAVIPFILVFGTTTIALRVFSTMIGAITLWLAYQLSYQLSGRVQVGLSAALLLAVDPTFVFWNRQGIFVTAITATIGLGAAYCWLRRLQGGGRLWSIAGGFLFGLGIFAKLLFIWLILALIGALFLLSLPGLLKKRRRPAGFPLSLLNQPPIQIKEILLTIPAFVLGCWPLIIYNIQTSGTLLSITRNAQTSYYGVNNLAIGSNLVERSAQFVRLLDGSHLWYLGRIVSNPVSIAVFVIVLLSVILPNFMTIRKRNSPPPAGDEPAAKSALFPFLVVGLVILASIQTVSALWVTHFAILMPWPAIAVALGSGFALIRLRPYDRAYVLRAIIWSGLGLLIITNLVSTLRYHQALTESGGLSGHSDAIYDLSNWLDNRAAGEVVAMDWGLAAPIFYLTEGQVNPIEVFGYAWQPDGELTARLTEFIEQPATYYLWRAPDEIIFDRSVEFKALYRPLRLEETIEEAFYERSGRPILGVTRLVPAGTAANPP